MSEGSDLFMAFERAKRLYTLTFHEEARRQLANYPQGDGAVRVYLAQVAAMHAERVQEAESAMDAAEEAYWRYRHPDERPRLTARLSVPDVANNTSGT